MPRRPLVKGGCFLGGTRFGANNAGGYRAEENGGVWGGRKKGAFPASAARKKYMIRKRGVRRQRPWDLYGRTTSHCRDSRGGHAVCIRGILNSMGCGLCGISARPRPPASQPASQPTSQPANQPTSQPANQPTSQPANQPTSQPANQPASQPANQPTSRPPTSPIYI